MKGLYFIAIVPPQLVAERIHNIRIEFSEKYHSEKALKPPVHLTLKEPFTMDIKEEIILKRRLHFIATQHQKFEHILKGFGRFQKHTIFIHAEKHAFLINLKIALKKMFKTSFYHVQQDQMPFNPHYTIAYRDIDDKCFEIAFSEYQDKTFYEKFICNKFILFKHDGKKWHNIEEFKLSGVPEITLFENSYLNPEKEQMIKA